MSDAGEVRQMSLYCWIQNGLRIGVAQWRSILVQQIHQLFADNTKIGNESFSKSEDEKNPVRKQSGRHNVIQNKAEAAFSKYL